MQKFFIETNQIENDKINIVGEDVKHISKVLRMKIGDTVQICNKETSKNYIAQIEKINNIEVIARIMQKLNNNNESNVELSLFQGLPKADKMELIIQKTTEIGVSRIIPVDMERCVVKLDEKEANRKIQRWQKIAESAAQQSKRDIIPLIDKKCKLKEIVKSIKEFDTFIVAYEEEKIISLKEELKLIPKKNNYKIGILIGPEGGIAKQEIEELKANGAKIISLGKRILRCETAPIVMASNIMYELEK